MEMLLTAVDAQAERLEGDADWSIIRAGAGDAMAPQTETARWTGPLLPGSYDVAVTVTTPDGPREGTRRIEVREGLANSLLVPTVPVGTVPDLPIDVAYACAEAPACSIYYPLADVAMALPQGWAAEAPARSADGRSALIVAATALPGSAEPFYVTLNMPQRDATLGPCVEVVAGTLCREHTQDADLLEDFELIRASLDAVQMRWPTVKDVDAARRLLTGGN